jgi:uncharacterized membrane protein YeaQ/YmgE (transglycosylase-associated protein family)
MTLPNLLLGTIIALLIGALFHTLRGGSGWRLLLYIGLSLAGFFLAQWLSSLFGWGLYKFGLLDIGLGVVGSLLFLIVGDWLSRVESKKKSV